MNRKPSVSVRRFARFCYGLAFVSVPAAKDGRHSSVELQRVRRHNEIVEIVQLPKLASL